MYNNNNFSKNEKRILKPVDGGFAFSVMMAGYFIIAFIGGFLLNLITEPETVVYYAISPLFSVLTFFLILFFYKKICEEKTTEFFYVKKTKPIYFSAVILFAVGMLFGFGFFNDLVAKFVVDLGGKVTSSNIPLNNIWQLLLFTLVFAIFPALFEELFFRSFMLGRVLKNVNSISAILCSALFFALYHASITQFVYQFIYGVVLGLLFYKTGSVICSCLLHFLNNFAVLLFGYLKFNINFYNPIIITLGILAVLSAFIITYMCDKKTSKKGESVKGLFIPYGIFGIAFCLLVIVLNVVA